MSDGCGGTRNETPNRETTVNRYRVVGADRANHNYQVCVIRAASRGDAEAEFLRRWPGGFIDSANLLTDDAARFDMTADELAAESR